MDIHKHNLYKIKKKPGISVLNVWTHKGVTGHTHTNTIAHIVIRSGLTDRKIRI